MGVVEWQDGDDATSLIERADRALYRSKHEGRNRASKAA
jgi:PleD family two-component response regulator